MRKMCSRHDYKIRAKIVQAIAGAAPLALTLINTECLCKSFMFWYVGTLNIFPSTHEPWGSTDALIFPAILLHLCAKKAVTILKFAKSTSFYTYPQRRRCDTLPSAIE